MIYSLSFQEADNVMSKYPLARGGILDEQNLNPQNTELLVKNTFLQ